MKKVLLLSGLLLINLIGFTQAGSNDPIFNTLDDCAIGDGTGFNQDVLVTAVQLDGKIIVGGLFTDYAGITRNHIARLNIDGSLDLSFDPLLGFNDDVYSINVQTDGKIIVGGWFTSCDIYSRNRIARLNSDGSIDLSFDPGTGFNSNVYSTCLQPDGKIIVSGSFTLFNSSASRNRIARLNLDGTLDITFDPATGFNNTVRNAIIEPGGKIIAAGEFTSFDGTNRSRIARLNTNGTIDTSFDPGSGFNSIVHALALQTDGKIIAVGDFSSFAGNACPRIARVHSNGTNDNTFYTNSGFDAVVFSCALQPDGKIIVGGNFNNFNGTSMINIARLTPTGFLDLSFDVGSGIGGSDVSSVVVQPDGKILVAGEFNFYDGIACNHLIRVNGNGSLDIDFDLPTGLGDVVYASTTQTDGRILLGGDFTSFNGIPANHMVRLNGDGTYDISFDIGLGFDARVYSLTTQPDGKIIASGSFTQFDGVARNKIARLNADGSLDSSFDPGTGFDNNVTSTLVQPDGKIICTGSFMTFNGSSAARICRLNPDGSIDTGFNSGTGFSAITFTAGIQSDGKIVVGGDFTSYNGNSINRISRLNTDGSIDLSFTPGTGLNDFTWSLMIQPDDKIVLCGNFTTVNGTSRNRIARLNANGSLDVSFTPGTGFNNNARSLYLQADGKVIVGGNFTSFNGTARNRIARLNLSGSLDTGFNPGTGFDNYVWTLTGQAGGKVVAAGDFSSFDGACRIRLARILGDCGSSGTFSTLNPVVCAPFTQNGYDFTLSGTYVQVLLNGAGCDSIITINLTSGVTYSNLYPITCASSYTENSQTYFTSGTYIQTIPNMAGCDSVITIYLTLNPPLDMTVVQTDIVLTSFETASSFQWLDCNNGYAIIPGEVFSEFYANTTGTFALEISNGACTDTSLCFVIDNQDFYNLPGYLGLYGEVFAFPVTTIDTCDALAIATTTGGVPPYTYDWFTQTNNENTDELDSLCEGAHTLKIMDNIGDSLFIDYYVTDTANFFLWADTTSLVYADTIYLAASNCLIDYSLPLDSAFVSQFYYIYPDTILGYSHFVEITYYQLGNMYIFQDTCSIGDFGWYLFDFSVYCPIKSFNHIKVALFDHYYSELLNLENSPYSFLIYPNPTNGSLMISGLVGKSQICVTTMMGEVVFKTESSNQNQSIDLGLMPAGTYLISVLNDNRIFNQIIIKQ